MKNTKRIMAILIATVIITGLIAGITSNVSAAGPYINYDCATEQDIIDALHPGSTDIYIKITLTDDIDIGDLSAVRPIVVDAGYTIPAGTGFTIPTGKDVIIDLNGFSITGSRGTYANTMIINNFGTLTLEDNSSTDVNAWGSIEIISTIVGSGHNAGSYVIQNSAGIVTFKSGRYINHGGADVPYVFNNMPSGTSDVTINVEGGYLRSIENDVFRMYQWAASVNNIVNINGGTLIGKGRVGWIHMGAGVIANPGTFQLNIAGGELLVSDDTLRSFGVIQVCCMYKADGNYPDVKVDISGGTLYSRPTVNDYGEYPTVGFEPMIFTQAEEDAMLLQMSTIPISFDISGGTFDNAPGYKNIDHADIWPWDYVALPSNNVKVSGGNFTYDPELYVQGAPNTPVACYIPAVVGDQQWYYVNNDYVSKGLANAGDSNRSHGIDTFEILRGKYSVDATTIDNVVKRDVELIVNANAIVTVETAGLLTNNGKITNNGVLTVNGGTLQNNAVVVNNNEFYHLTGNVNGAAHAFIQHGINAITDASNSLTVFFIDAPYTTSIPVIGVDVAGYSYEYIRNNHWAIVLRINFQVFYNGNSASGGSVPVDFGLYDDGDSVTVAANPGGLYQTGYTFSGWAFNSAASVADFVVSGSSVSPDRFTISDDVTLYAVWSPINYTVTFAPGDHGTFTAQVTSGLYYGALTPNAPTVTGETGWNFTGWQPTISNTVTNNVTYVAQWAQITTPTPTPTVAPSASPSPSSSASPSVTASATPSPSASATTPSPVASLPASAPTTVTATPEDPRGGSDEKAKWAVINLILGIVGVALAIITTLFTLFKRKRDEATEQGIGKGKQGSDGRYFWRLNAAAAVNDNDKVTTTKSQHSKRWLWWLIAAIVLAVVGIVVFLLTEDMKLPMGWVDKWTIVNAIIFVVELVTILCCVRTQKNEQTNTTAQPHK